MAGDADHTTPLPEATAADDAPVPKLPRGRGIRLSRPQLVRIAGTVFLLVFLLVVQRPCANAVSTFVTDFGSAGGRGSASAMMPRLGTVDVPRGSAALMGSGGSAMSAGAAGSGSDGPSLDQYEHLRPGMTDEEIRAVIERARAKAAGRQPGP